MNTSSTHESSHVDTFVTKHKWENTGKGGGERGQAQKLYIHQVLRGHGHRSFTQIESFSALLVRGAPRA